MDKNNSQIISFLRFPLTFLVVVIHCRGNISPIADWSSLSTADLYHIVKVLFSDVIAQIAVPTFFFISGYLFFYNIRKFDLSTYKKKLKGRMHSIFIPYILWNLLCIPLTMTVLVGESFTGTSSSGAAIEYWENIKWLHIFWDYSSHNDYFSNLLGMNLLITGPVLGTYWYVRDLILITLLSPLIYWFFNKTGKWGCMLIILLLILHIWPYMSLRLQCLYFVLGAYWSINGKNLYSENTYLRRGNYLLTVVLLLIMVRIDSLNSYWGWQLMPLYTLSGMFTAFNLGYYVIKKNPCFKFHPLLTSSSFFVYSIHIEFTLSLGFIISKTMFMHSQQPLLLILQYLVTPFAIYAASILIFWMMEKTMPKVLKVLNGSR